MKKVKLNEGWLFHSDIDPVERAVTLPYDAMRYEKRIKGLRNGAATGYYPGGLYTYTKVIQISEQEINKKVYLEFCGIYQKSSIYLNDEKIGGRIYGYSDQFVELTGKLKPGSNVIKVLADNSQVPNSRWYSGSGIYRDVYLWSGEEEYIKPDGIKVKTVALYPAEISVKTDAVINESKIKVRLLKNGSVVSEGEGADVKLSVEKAKLWSSETPELYDIAVTIEKDGIVIDSQNVRTGIRILQWDAEKGFQVNGKTVKLRGGCVHHDNGPLGAEDFYDADVRKFQKMKDAGFNAVRMSHNPASENVLQACDEVGLYVMNETFDTWLLLKSPYDYAMYFEQEHKQDVIDMVRIAYNHPSVVMYSIGNEVALKDINKSVEITRELVSLIKHEDSSRIVLNSVNLMMAMMGNSENPEKDQNAIVEPRENGNNDKLTGSALANVMMTFIGPLIKLAATEKQIHKLNGAIEPLDALGLNYAEHLYEKYHQDYPDRIMCGSETFPKKIASNWDLILKYPWVIGDFQWTAWDYLGEAGIGIPAYKQLASFRAPYPAAISGCGHIDLIGDVKCQGIYSSIVFGTYQAPYIAVHPLEHAGEKVSLGLWTMTDAIHTWTWNGYEGTTASVDVYSRQNNVELFLNGKSLGRKHTEKYIASYKVQYAPGTLTAVQYDNNGNETGRDELISADRAVKVLPLPERKTVKADTASLVYIPVSITDSMNRCDTCENREVSISVRGEGELAAVGSGAYLENYPYTNSIMCTERGRMLAVIRSNGKKGKIQVKFETPGFDPAEIEIIAE